MTKRDFFILLVKIFGLFSLITSLFSVLPSNIAWSVYDFDVKSIVWIVFTIIVLLTLFVLLVFKAGKVVEWLKLDKGFDDDRIEFGALNSLDILKIAIFIIGGLLVIDSIPDFLTHVLFAFKNDIKGIDTGTNDAFYMSISGLKVVIGYLLLSQYAFVAKRFLQEKKE